MISPGKLAAILLALLTACGAPESEVTLLDAEVDLAANPLYVEPESFDFSGNPELLERLRSTPHRYFRFINVPFSEEVCRRFGSGLAAAPSFNLHGDAHMEQYAMTDRGWGMTDFDDSSIGPAVIDLARFIVSLRLGCVQEGCGEETVESLVDDFLRGYRAALEDPDLAAPEPRYVQRHRAAFKEDREGYFSFVESSMEPVPEAEAREAVEALEPYFDAMLAEHDGLDDGYFTVEKLGYLRLGVGSALDLKYLARVRGATDDPFDDVVLEIKQVRDLAGISCITVAPGADPLRILRGHLRIANQPYRFLGYLRFRARNFWVHAWEANYEELDVEEALAAPDEMAEIAYDVGVQLGRGHTRKLEAELDNQLRREQLRLLDRDGAAIRDGGRELARLAVDAWERFKAAAQDP